MYLYSHMALFLFALFMSWTVRQNSLSHGGEDSLQNDISDGPYKDVSSRQWKHPLTREMISSKVVKTTFNLLRMYFSPPSKNPCAIFHEILGLHESSPSGNYFLSQKSSVKCTTQEWSYPVSWKYFHGFFFFGNLCWGNYIA